MSNSAETNTSDVNMRPVTVLLGITMGTVVSIASGLLLVSFLFWLLRDDYPRLDSEIPELLRATGMFTGLSLAACFSFYGSLKSRQWRYITITLLCIGLYLSGYYYWPE